jgi:hypothetical protein
MIMRVGWLRLVLEIVFILGVAAVTWALEVNKVWIVVFVLLAWVVTALLERSASQHARARTPGDEYPVAPPPPAAADANPVAEALEAPARRPDLFSRVVAALSGSRAEQREAPPAGTARPRHALPDDVEPRACATCGRPIPLERLLAVPDATQCLDCKRAGSTVAVAEAEQAPPVEEQTSAPAPGVEEPAVPQPVAVVAEPEPEPAAVAAAAPALSPPPAAIPLGASSWNVWELERLARARAGGDVARDEEWGFLLVYLRDFADPDGNLPSDFDGLVRESFAELLG